MLRGTKRSVGEVIHVQQLDRAVNKCLGLVAGQNHRLVSLLQKMLKKLKHYLINLSSSTPTPDQQGPGQIKVGQ